ncbi:hypothetical protein WMW72_25525 [Paenibacillus filicis]|uniref:Uncharacterized protein n=1 Tax=Paenibacillus filicis TaxID=669464 RepID=A0ABU9DQZ1_9BACL
MSWAEKENKAKLHMLNSLARSQRALTRMLESMAGLTEYGGAEGDGQQAEETSTSRAEGEGRPSAAAAKDLAGGAHAPLAREWLAQLEALGRYQRAMAERLGLIRIRKLRSGVPAAPWLNGNVTQGRQLRRSSRRPAAAPHGIGDKVGAYADQAN